MPVLLRAGTGRIPHLIATWRKRPCALCRRSIHVTLWSPSTFYGHNIAAGLEAAFGGTPAVACDGQCCIRCTRGLRGP